MFHIAAEIAQPFFVEAFFPVSVTRRQWKTTGKLGVVSVTSCHIVPTGLTGASVLSVMFELGER